MGHCHIPSVRFLKKSAGGKVTHQKASHHKQSVKAQGHLIAGLRSGRKPDKYRQQKTVSIRVIRSDCIQRGPVLSRKICPHAPVPILVHQNIGYRIIMIQKYGNGKQENASAEQIIDLIVHPVM